MLHVSTRGEAPPIGFTDALLAGLARDGGLYVPQSWPVLPRETIQGFAGRRYADVVKAVAMQLLGRLMDHALRARGTRATIVGATSGDTGSAAVEAFRGLNQVDVFILYPHGRVSDVQRRQMTGVDAPNVHAIAVDGSFDDCQNAVKAMFNHARFR